jgi:AraC family transcriptional regulator
MVCPRCIKVVNQELTQLGYEVSGIQLGEALIIHEKEIDFEGIKKALRKHGFDLLDNRKELIVEKIKTIIIEQIHHNNLENLPFNFSYLLEKRLELDYPYISSLFSSSEGSTIEKFVIHQKIEKVKELLIYDELTLSQIAYQLGYKSVQHLSTQFKKVTGLTPSTFKNLSTQIRKPLDEIK